jgi:hypothetical protein
MIHLHQQIQKYVNWPFFFRRTITICDKDMDMDDDPSRRVDSKRWLALFLPEPTICDKYGWSFISSSLKTWLTLSSGNYYLRQGIDLSHSMDHSLVRNWRVDLSIVFRAFWNCCKRVYFSLVAHILSAEPCENNLSETSSLFINGCVSFPQPPPFLLGYSEEVS